MNEKIVGKAYWLGKERSQQGRGNESEHDTVLVLQITRRKSELSQ